MNTDADPMCREITVADPRRSAAREVLARFVRALKAVRLYPDGNAVVVDGRCDFQRALERFLGEYGELALTVTRGAIHLDGEPVHEDRTSEMRLAFHLTLEGVRELIFHESVTPEEAARLLTIFTRLGRETDDSDDLDTLLWQEDLKGISVFILDEFYDDVGDEEEFLEFVEEGRPDPDAGAINACERGELVDALGEACILPNAPMHHLGILATEDLLLIEDLLMEQQRRDPMTTFGSILVDVLGIETDPMAFERLCAVLGRQVRVLAEQKDLLRAARVADEAERLIESIGPEERRRSIADAIASIPVAVILAELPDAVAEADQQGLEDLRSLLSRLALREPDAVVKLLERSELRDLAFAALQDHLDRLVPYLAARVRDPRPAVVQAVIQLLGESGNPHALSLVFETMGHADHRVRIAAVHAAAHMPGGHTIIERALADESDEVRLAALRSPGGAMGHGILLRLKQRIATRDIASTSFIEKREIFHALARSGGPEIVPFLARVLQRRTLFHRDRTDEIRACAASALGLVATREAMEILDGHLEDRSDRVREATFGAIRDAARRQR